MDANQTSLPHAGDSSQEERDKYLNTLPLAQRVSTWSTGTLWSVIIVFAVLLLALIVGAIMMFAQ